MKSPRTTPVRFKQASIFAIVGSLLAYPLSLLGVELLAPGLIHVNYFGRHDAISDHVQLFSIAGVLVGIILAAIASELSRSLAAAQEEAQRGVPLAVRVILWGLLSVTGTAIHFLTTFLIHAALR